MYKLYFIIIFFLMHVSGNAHDSVIIEDNTNSVLRDLLPIIHVTAGAFIGYFLNYAQSKRDVKHKQRLSRMDKIEQLNFLLISLNKQLTNSYRECVSLIRQGADFREAIQKYQDMMDKDDFIDKVNKVNSMLMLNIPDEHYKIFTEDLHSLESVFSTSNENKINSIDAQVAEDALNKYLSTSKIIHEWIITTLKS